MILIIQNDNASNIYNNKDFFVLKDICKIKELKNPPYTVLLIDIMVDDDGLLEHFNYFFEEIIISLDCIAVITSKPSEKLREICDFHKISLLEINQ
jgi:hypothetical protein